MKKKRIVAVIGTALVAVILCIVINILYVVVPGKSDINQQDQTEQQVELTLVYAYQNQQWNNAVLATVEGFEKAHPDIKVNIKTQYQDKLYDDALNKLVARDELGDIVQLKTPDAYAACGALVPVREDIAALTDTVYERDGQVYGVCALGSTSGIIYNKEMFENAGLTEPDTYEDFLRICNHLEWRGVTPIGLSGSELWHLEFWMNHFLRVDVLSQSENWLADCAAGKTAWTDDEAVSMLEHMQELFGQGYQNSDWSTISESGLVYQMSKQQVAMIYAGPFMINSIRELNPDLELGWFYVPDTQGNIYAANTKDVFWSVTESCGEDEETYDAAMEFLQYFYSHENYEMILNEMNGFSTAKDEATEELLRNGEMVYEAFCDADDFISGYIGDSNTPQGFEEQMLLIVKEIMNNRITPQDAAVQIQEVWDSCMQGQKSGGEGT